MFEDVARRHELSVPRLQPIPPVAPDKDRWMDYASRVAPADFPSIAPLHSGDGHAAACGPAPGSLWYNEQSTDAVMDISRRTFLRASLTGGVAVSALGFDLRPAHAAAPPAQDPQRHRVPDGVPVLRGRLRHDRLRPRQRRPEHEEHRHPRRRRPRQPDQRRHALPEGRLADAARDQPAAPAPAAAAQGGRVGVGRGRLGHGDGLVRAQVQGLARCLVPRAGRRRAGSSTAPTGSPGSAAPPSRTRTPTSSRRRCAPWGLVYIDHQARI